MKDRKNDYYLKNGSLDLTMLDEEEQIQIDEEEITTSKEKNKYISLNNQGFHYNTKSIIVEDKRYDEVVQEISSYEKEEQDLLVKGSIKPYMSEEIHSVLKEMSTYLLEENDELAASLQDDYEEYIEDDEDQYDLAQDNHIAFQEEYDEYLLDLNNARQIDYLEQEKSDKSNHTSLIEEFRVRHYRILQGKRLNSDIISQSGLYIGRRGDMISQNTILLAQENGCILKLVMHSD